MATAFDQAFSRTRARKEPVAQESRVVRTAAELVVGQKAKANLTTGGVSVEEARAAMLAAGSAPSGQRGGYVAFKTKMLADGYIMHPKLQAWAKLNPETQQWEPYVETEAPKFRANPQQGGNVPTVVHEPVDEPAVSAATAVSATVEPTTSTEKTERFTDPSFDAEILQENGEWVARILYKNGSGTEEFRADTKNALMLKLITGKGHATLRVKRAVREAKLGQKPVDIESLEYQYALDYAGLSKAEYDALPAGAKKLVQDNIGYQVASLWQQQTPQYHGTPENSERLLGYLANKKLPVTVHNLQVAFEELTEDDILEKKPEVKPVALPVPVATTRAEDSASVVPASAAPTSTVVRKRGTTSLVPSHSSVPEGGHVNGSQESISTPQEPSEQELRAMPIADLGRIVRKQYNRNRA